MRYREVSWYEKNGVMDVDRQRWEVSGATRL